MSNLLLPRKSLILPPQGIVRAYNDADYDRWIRRRYDVPFTPGIFKREAAYGIVGSANNWSSSAVTSLATGAFTPASTDNWLLTWVKFLRSSVPATFVVTNSVSGTGTECGSGGHEGASNGHGIKAFLQKVPAASSQTCTVSWGGTDTCQQVGIHTLEISGLDLSAAYLDSSYACPAAAVGTGTDAISSGVFDGGSLASQPAGVFAFVGATAQSADPASAAGTGYTGLTKVFSHFGILQGLPMHRRVTATTAIAATATDATSGASEIYVAGVVALAEPVASGHPAMRRMGGIEYGRGGMRGVF